MGKWREEEKTLKCGCKVGRSKQGLWFFDYICKEHLPEVQDEKRLFSYEKSLKFTEKLNKEMKELEKKEKANKEKVDKLKGLSKTEKEAFEVILEKKELAIVSLPIKLQGAIGRLLSRGLVERFRAKYEWTTKVAWSKEERTVYKITNWIRLKNEKNDN